MARENGSPSKGSCKDLHPWCQGSVIFPHEISVLETAAGGTCCDPCCSARGGPLRRAPVGNRGSAAAPAVRRGELASTLDPTAPPPGRLERKPGQEPPASQSANHLSHHCHPTARLTGGTVMDFCRTQTTVPAHAPMEAPVAAPAACQRVLEREMEASTKCLLAAETPISRCLCTPFSQPSMMPDMCRATRTKRRGMLS